MKQAKKVIIVKETEEGQVTSKVFENAENAAKYLKTTPNNIRQSIRQQYKVKGGYYVDYNDES